MKTSLSFLLFLAIVTGCNPTSEQQTEQQKDTSGYEAEVAEAVEALRVQLVDPEQAVLEGIADDILSYGHSNGHIEDKAEFIASLISQKFNFETLDLTEQTIDLSGETAIVRHQLQGNTADAGKEPGTANLKVMQVWQKKGDDWKLLSRQAVKIVTP